MRLPIITTILTVASVTATNFASAKVSLSPILSDNMVMQQQATVTMHGKSTPAAKSKSRTRGMENPCKPK